MKVLTLNTHSWIEENPEQKLNQLAETLAAQDYDIIALQEVNQSMQAEAAEDDTFIVPVESHFPVHIKSDNFALLLVKLLREHGLSYYWSWAASHIGYSKYDEGVALLTKTPFKAESHLVSDIAEYDNHLTRKLLKATLSIGDKPISVISAHYSWWKDGKGNNLFQSEWQRTLKAFKSDEKEMLLVMGDFNNDPSVKSEGYDWIVEKTPFLSDAFIIAEKTSGEATVKSEIDGWKGHSDDKRIDYIFVGNKFEVEQYRVVFDGRREPIVSDHFGIEAHINIKTY